MSIFWDYPVYLVPHGTGYVSLYASEDAAEQMLVVYTREQSAVAFMEDHGLLGIPRPLQNAREFRWLLEALRAPVTRVAFDPQVQDRQANPRWQIPVKKLLEDHLEADFSPWNYPVFAIAQDFGFACIRGRTSDGRPLTAVAVFTSSEKAEAYLRSAGETGQLRELTNMSEARRFLNSLSVEVFSVAIDPVVHDSTRTAKYCFDIATLLEKYLVSADS